MQGDTLGSWDGPTEPWRLQIMLDESVGIDWSADATIGSVVPSTRSVR
jgi:hypothetical protein